MPKWRKLWTKIVDSLDVNAMPDDFTRLLWTFLPIIVDSEGRGIDDASWVRSRAMPLRHDVDNERVAEAMEYYATHGMIERYSVQGREFFWIPSFHAYQGNTDREAPSHISPPPKRSQNKVKSNSRVTHDLGEEKSHLDSDSDSESDANAEKPIGADAHPKGTEENLYSIAKALSEVCHMDLKANRPMIFREAKLLSKATPAPTPELIVQNYNGNGGFWSSQWQGKKGQLPKPSDVRQTWGQWLVETGIGSRGEVAKTGDMSQAELAAATIRVRK